MHYILNRSNGFFFNFSFKLNFFGIVCFLSRVFSFFSLSPLLLWLLFGGIESYAVTFTSSFSDLEELGIVWAEQDEVGCMDRCSILESFGDLTIDGADVDDIWVGLGREGIQFANLCNPSWTWRIHWSSGTLPTAAILFFFIRSGWARQFFRRGGLGGHWILVVSWFPLEIPLLVRLQENTTCGEER